VKQLPLPVINTRERKAKFVKEFWQKEKPVGVLCCKFSELIWSNGCPYGCDYCYLKGTFRVQKWNGFEQTIFSNSTEMWKEIEDFLKKEESSILHTGELADSLAAPGAPEIMADIVTRFGMQSRHTLLLLTKSDNVDALLSAKHNGMTVVGFSINPQPIVRKYELGTASTRKRMQAARKCVKAGYPVMVRVDPMIPVPGWKKYYSELFAELNKIDLRGVVVGTLRAYPGLAFRISKELRSMLKNKDIDGRYHIDANIRNEMYEFAFSRIKAKRMGICKESGEMWGQLSKKHSKRFICNCRCQ